MRNYKHTSPVIFLHNLLAEQRAGKNCKQGCGTKNPLIAIERPESKISFNYGDIFKSRYLFFDF